MTPEAARLDAVVAALEALQDAGYYLHDRDGRALDKAEFYQAIVIALDAVLAHGEEVGTDDARSQR